MADSCEHGNEHSGSIKGEEFHDYLNECDFFKKMLYIASEPYAVDGVVFEIFKSSLFFIISVDMLNPFLTFGRISRLGLNIKSECNFCFHLCLLKL
jgi:hypothetical protein